MKINRAYKTELNPNNHQRGAFIQHSGAARFVYNWALADRIERYEAGNPTNLYEQKRRFNALKDEQFPWIRETAYCTTEQAFRNLDMAYKNFFRRVKQGKEEKGFPHFKSRKQGIGSFIMRGSIHIEDSQIRLPRIGWVRLKERSYLPTNGVKVLSVNVSERAGCWLASVQAEMDVPDPEPGRGEPLGVDFGLKTLAVCSDGTAFQRIKPLIQQEEDKLKRLQREFSRRKKGSKNREKTKHKIAKCHAKIANIRKHALHNVSYHVTAKTKPSTVVVEDLHVKGMLANHRLAKAISDASFGELRRQIGYKGQWYGVDVVTAGRFYPSSKTCSGCGTKKPLTLADRVYICEECGLVIDRDLNAALNLASLVRCEGGNAAGLSVELV